MQILLSLLIITACITESIFFILLAVKGQDIDDMYFRKYRGYNLFWFTLAKAIIVAVVVYIILFPEGLILGSGKLGGYIIGVLYCYIALRFLGNCRTYYRRRLAP
jgi:hypothetical protein